MQQKTFYQLATPLKPPKKIKQRILLIQKISLFLSKTQGRDKLCKLLQYLFKLLSTYYTVDTYKNTKYTSLSQSIKNARKIFRLFKSINQYEGMAYILFNQEENFTNLLKILARMCFFFYWACDNIAILGKIKLFRLNFMKFYKIGYSFWFFALFFINSTLIYELFLKKIQTMKKINGSSKQLESDLPSNCPLLPDFQMKKQTSFKQISPQQLKQIRKQKILSLMRYLFDMIPAGKDSEILQVIFNRVIPQKISGFCGVMSALISIYQTSKGYDNPI